MADVIQTALFGLVAGCVLAVEALGFAMIRQTEGFLNLAHGQFVALGAMLGFLFVAELGLPLAVSTLLAAVAVGFVAVVCARLILEPVRGRGVPALLFSSLGVGFVIYAAIVAAFGPDIYAYPVDFGPQFSAASVSLTFLELLIVALTATVVAALHLFLTKTSLGTAVRAVASNPGLAELRGVPVQLVSNTVWFTAGGLAGIGGVLLATLRGVTAETGWSVLALILAATVVGGLGSIYGVVAAGILLGVLMDLSTLVLPTAYRPAIAFVLLVLVLLLKPEGLFAVRRRHEEMG